MTGLTGKDLLKGIRKQKALLDAIEEDQRQTADEIARVMALPATKRQRELLKRLADYNKKSIAASSKLLALKEKGKSVIEQLTDESEKAVLYLRYIDGKTWGEITKAIPCGWTTVFRIERRAFRNLDKTE